MNDMGVPKFNGWESSVVAYQRIETDQDLVATIMAIAAVAENLSLNYRPAYQAPSGIRKAQLDQLVRDLKAMAQGYAAVSREAYQLVQDAYMAKKGEMEKSMDNLYRRAKNLGYSENEACRIARMELTSDETRMAEYWAKHEGEENHGRT